MAAPGGRHTAPHFHAGRNHRCKANGGRILLGKQRGETSENETCKFQDQKFHFWIYTQRTGGLEFEQMLVHTQFHTSIIHSSQKVEES